MNNISQILAKMNEPAPKQRIMIEKMNAKISTTNSKCRAIIKGITEVTNSKLCILTYTTNEPQPK